MAHDMMMEIEEHFLQGALAEQGDAVKGIVARDAVAQRGEQAVKGCAGLFDLGDHFQKILLLAAAQDGQHAARVKIQQIG